MRRRPTITCTRAARVLVSEAGTRAPRGRRRLHHPALAVLVASTILLAGTGCASHETTSHDGSRPAPGRPLSLNETVFLDSLQVRTFRWFWELSDPRTHLTPDRAPTRSFASIAATGFALTAYPIGIQRGYVSREAGRRRVLDTLEFLWWAPQGPATSGTIGHEGFFYHFLDPATGHRFEQVELSTVDTALLIAGALFCQSYFVGPDPDEARIRALADSLYARVNWQWASPRPPAVSHGWTPEAGFLPYDWRGYNEAMLLYILAVGSPTHSIDPAAWSEWTSRYRWGKFHGFEHLGFAPLFGHQYTHVWIDLRGIHDDYMAARDIDYFENSRRAVLAHRAYAIENPMGWTGYGASAWGLSACDGPVHGTFEIAGERREVHTYWARGASFTQVADDGTLSPPALAASIVFVPEVVIPVITGLAGRYGEHLFSTYGFLDAFNPSFTLDVPVQHGRVVPELGWFDTDYLGIDQGPTLAMLENHHSELVWRTMRSNPHVQRGLRRVGFTGGWLDATQDAP